MPVKTKDYQQVIVELGIHGIIPQDFAEANRFLASYRNRLVHLYWEVSPKELHQVISEHLPDIVTFCDHFESVLEHPDRYGIGVE